MSYSSALHSFQTAKTKTSDPTIESLAEGLEQLAKAIEIDIKKLEAQLADLIAKH